MLGWLEISIIVVLLVLLFGRGKISELMGDVAKGIKSFKKGMAEEDKSESSTVKKDDDDDKIIEHVTTEKVKSTPKAKAKKS